MDLLKFITAGSVDDGKSTLIGRLLYDSKNIMSDHLETLARQSKHKNGGEIDLAYLTDGLRAEREQGITIDVAYRYFSTPKRKFIIADAPGHVQYTRNMITGASNVSLIIILIDARNGIVEQTRRHSIIASLLKIPQVVVAINKMDMTGYDQAVFDDIKTAYEDMAQQLGLKNVIYTPISALQGDNIVEPSSQMTWHQGKPLLQLLEEIDVEHNPGNEQARFQVQYVIRPRTDTLHDYRGYAGQITSGIYKKGDSVTVLPTGLPSTIAKLEIHGKEVAQASAPESVVIHLENDLDVSRGDTIVPSGQLPVVSKELDALLCWMDEQPMQTGGKYYLQHHQRTVKAMVKNVAYKVDVNTLEQQPASTAKLNEIVKVSLKTATPLAYDAYASLQATGSAILIDETSNQTVAAVLLE